MFRALSMYGPVLFLGALAGFSFWLSPLDDIRRPPEFATVLTNVRYVRMQPDGVLEINASRVQQTSAGRAELARPQLSHSSGNIQLQGDDGFIHAPTPYAPRLQINNVRGVLAGQGNRITLRAQSVLFDSGNDNLSGKFPLISGDVGEIRGDTFRWNAQNGLQVQGNVRSTYQLQTP